MRLWLRLLLVGLDAIFSVSVAIAGSLLYLLVWIIVLEKLPQIGLWELGILIPISWLAIFFRLLTITWSPFGAWAKSPD